MGGRWRYGRVSNSDPTSDTGAVKIIKYPISIKNLQGGTFAFEHLYLQILDSHIPYEVFCGWYCLRNRNKANKGIKKQVLLLFRCQTSNSTNQS